MHPQQQASSPALTQSTPQAAMFAAAAQQSGPNYASGPLAGMPPPAERTYFFPAKHITKVVNAVRSVSLWCKKSRACMFMYVCVCTHKHTFWLWSHKKHETHDDDAAIPPRTAHVPWHLAHTCRISQMTNISACIHTELGPPILLCCTAHMHASVCMHACMYACFCVCVYIYIYIYIDVSSLALVLYVCVYLHTHIFTYTYIHCTVWIGVCTRRWCASACDANGAIVTICAVGAFANRVGIFSHFASGVCAHLQA
jgi:hypothetical protein